MFRAPTLALIGAAVASGVQHFIFDSSVVVTGPHRDGTAIGDHEPASHPGFWPHVDMVADIENQIRRQSDHGTIMIALRCGHFAGERYNLGLLSLLLPRPKTWRLSKGIRVR